jgi:hypothetical protein
VAEKSQHPDLTVVVPSVNGWSDLAGCLEALRAQRNGAVVEVVVADRVGDSVRAPLRERFPEVRLVEAPRHTSIPALRAMAFREARGSVVGVIEDHVIVPPDWARRMLEAHREGAQVVGGAVENAATGRLVDWAAFLCEYSHCLTPPPAGPATWVTGNNVTYRRDLLESFRATIEREGWENLLHDALRGAGITLTSRPDIRVGHKMHYTVGLYAAQRFLYSRSFAGARLADSGAAKRGAYGLLALALPPLLLWRVVRNVWRSGRFRSELLRSLPLLAFFTLAWAAGEAAGAWLGAGDSLSRVR